MRKAILIGLGCGAVALSTAYAQAPGLKPFPMMPSISAAEDGTLVFAERSIPLPPLMSEEAKAKYRSILARSLAPPPPAGQAAQMANMGAGIAAAREAARKVFPVGMVETEIGGVKVERYTPATVPARNRNRVIMMFNSPPVGVILANISQTEVITVHYVPTTPRGQSEIAAVYRELLKTHKPTQIAMVGLSGGCQYGGNTAMWLPTQKLPFPGAMGLLTCAGGGIAGDTRTTLDGLDPQLSSYTMQGASRRARPAGARPPAAPGEPQSEILNNPVVPKGFPPSYLLAGTRDLSLSQTVLLHRKLRNAGVIADLNVFEGMWHGFNMEPDLPETREATADLAAFLDRHLAR